MSIAKRVGEAIEKMGTNDPEGALLPISAAVDATAKRYYGHGGRKSYKDFLHENLGLITKVALGGSILNLNLEYDHPDLPPNANGKCTIEDVLYHVVRCGLAHDAAIPSNLKFLDENKFTVEGNQLVLPSSLIYGLIVAVVVCPENVDQTTSDKLGLSIRGFPVSINAIWGKKQELENLYAAMDAITRRDRRHTDRSRS